MVCWLFNCICILYNYIKCVSICFGLGIYEEIKVIKVYVDYESVFKINK